MKESLLQYLICPVTKKELLMEVRKREGSEVIEGFLRTEAGTEYPIIRGVPRMLPQNLLKHLPKDYPDFFSKYRSNLTDPLARDVQRHTQEAFGYEWTWADDYDADNFNHWIPDVLTMEQLLFDKLGLEVGCGAGRHAENTAKLAKTHIAVDLSCAVDSAFARNRDSDNCHIVQADCFNLPFREGLFDYVYCLGVLQHMHDPPQGFQCLAKQPKHNGGVLLVNVYQSSRPFLIGALEILRKVTTKMSNSSLRKFSEVCGFIDFYCFIYPWKFIKETPFGLPLRRIVPDRVQEYSKHDLSTCIVDWFDRLSCPVKKHYSDDQLRAFYNTNGYSNVIVSPYWKAFWNGYGQRTAI